MSKLKGMCAFIMILFAFSVDAWGGLAGLMGLALVDYIDEFPIFIDSLCCKLIIMHLDFLAILGVSISGN